jgi:hypothetical protein
MSCTKRYDLRKAHLTPSTSPAIVYRIRPTLREDAHHACSSKAQQPAASCSSLPGCTQQLAVRTAVQQQVCSTEEEEEDDDELKNKEKDCGNW